MQQHEIADDGTVEDPALVCEGTGQAVRLDTAAALAGTCRVCGAHVLALDDGTAEPHETPDAWPLPKPVMAAYPWPTNAELIADCARLGYLAADRRTIDPTFGRGIWWKRWRPDELVAHDLRLDGVDFRELPHETSSFDAAAYDPPYVAVGGRKTTGMPEFHDRFGLTDAPRRPDELQELIDEGLRELARVVKPGGLVLAKCQDYVTSGKLWAGTHHTLTAALAGGYTLVDRLERIQPNPRPQPASNRRQVHARRNLSTLFVLKVGR